MTTLFTDMCALLALWVLYEMNWWGFHCGECSRFCLPASDPCSLVREHHHYCETCCLYHLCGPGSTLGQAMWYFWWTKWHWGRFSPSTAVSPASSLSSSRSTLHHPGLVKLAHKWPTYQVDSVLTQSTNMLPPGTWRELCHSSGC
jgi:hypothetical protein